MVKCNIPTNHCLNGLFTLLSDGTSQKSYSKKVMIRPRCLLACMQLIQLRRGALVTWNQISFRTFLHVRASEKHLVTLFYRTLQCAVGILGS